MVHFQSFKQRIFPKASQRKLSVRESFLSIVTRLSLRETMRRSCASAKTRAGILNLSRLACKNPSSRMQLLFDPQTQVPTLLVGCRSWGVMQVTHTFQSQFNAGTGGWMRGRTRQQEMLNPCECGGSSSVKSLGEPFRKLRKICGR